MTQRPPPDPTATFESHRRFLKGLAYRMLGSVAEAEDIVQDCWLRWREVEHAKVEAPKAFLAQAATRLCLDRLRLASRQREQYVGIWLPDPWMEDASASSSFPGADDMLAMAQDLEIAFLLVLHKLTPPERAVFLLNEVFEWDFDAIAQALDRSPAACRQLAHRARQRLATLQEAGPLRPCDKALDIASCKALHDKHLHPPRRDVTRDMAVAVAFAQALRGGDIQALAQTLADDVVFMSDGGGKANAVPRPLHGAQKVAQVLLGFAKQWDHATGLVLPAAINGMPGAIFLDGHGRVVQTMAIGMGGQGLIDGIYVVRNPDKLTHMTFPRHE
jgi:RNA polymerase sigma-70 factor (ECF subfamily)